MKFLILFSLFISGCMSWPCGGSLPDIDGLIVGVPPGRIQPLPVVFSEALKPDIMGHKIKLEVIEVNRSIYLVRKAMDKGKNCYIQRTELDLAETETGVYYMMRMGGVTETCAGKNCTHCGFKKIGGCECINSLNICEHTITKNHDLLRLF